MSIRDDESRSVDDASDETIHSLLTCKKKSEFSLPHDVKTNKNRAVAAKPRDATINFDRYGVYRQLFSFNTRGSWHSHAYVLKY